MQEHAKSLIRLIRNLLLWFAVLTEVACSRPQHSPHLHAKSNDRNHLSAWNRDVYMEAVDESGVQGIESTGTFNVSKQPKSMYSLGTWHLWSEYIGNIHQPPQPALSVWSQWTWRPRPRISALLETSSPFFWMRFGYAFHLQDVCLVQPFFMLWYVVITPKILIWFGNVKSSCRRWR